MFDVYDVHDTAAGSMLTQKTIDGRETVIKQDMPTHKEAMQLVLAAMLDEEKGALKNINEISAVGHRVLHSAEDFNSSVVIDDEVIRICEKNAVFGPLHMPGNIACIKSCREVMKGVPMVAVFDTTFHSTMPAKAYMYGIPYEVYEQHKIRKYGFHGTSHRFVSKRFFELQGINPEGTKIIVCHLGNGSSLCAVKDGKCFDTSMGLSPLEGLVMGTRCGDIDPYIPLYICKSQNKTPDEVNEILNKKSGMYGMCGYSDNRDVETLYGVEENATNALNAYVHSIIRFIGSYIAVLGGVDALVFTAGIGENGSLLRSLVLKRLSYLGITVDEEANSRRGSITEISTIVSILLLTLFDCFLISVPVQFNDL